MGSLRLLLRIDDISVPQVVKQLLKEDGYEELYPPQAEAIKAGVLDRKNLVLASPTASGKTLTAELCILKDILERDGKALYLTPLRALASEKFEEFRKYTKIRKASGRAVRVAITSGDYDSADYHLGTYDIIIATNEKADSLLRHKAPWMSEISVVVADEVHLLTEGDRGPTLEVVLTRLIKLNPHAQFLALSATIRNSAEVAEWVRAVPVTTEWRPVPLREGVHYEGEIQFKDGSSKAILRASQSPVLDISVEVVDDGGQVLVFTETRRHAVEMGERCARALAKEIPRAEARACQEVAERILSSGERTRLSEALAKQVSLGAGFHHAGLGGLHRKIVEDAFRSGRIKILAATPTLAAGVNLPARTVIISSYERYEPGYGRYPISVLEYKQMCGRAGRPKFDDYGETVLIARSEDEQDYLLQNYVLSEPERLWSKLGSELVLRPHVLATVATGFAHTETGLDDFFSRTFYAHQLDPKIIRAKLGDIIRFLVKENMLTYQAGQMEATDFGRRVSELYIDPVSAVIIRDGLYRRAKNTTEMSFLHLIARSPDLSPKLHPRRGEDDLLAALAMDRYDEFMCDVPQPYDEDYGVSFDEFLAEVKAAKVLLDWIDEASEESILENHRVEPGDLLRLIDTADWLLYATHELAQLFGHKDLLRPLADLRLRVSKGVKKELIPLVVLEGIGRARARALYAVGLRTLADLRKTGITDLMKIPLIGPTLAKRIKEQAGGLIHAEEWELVKAAATKERQREQRLLTDYG